MRLLRCSSDGGFSLTRDLTSPDVIPPYAILSHTWQKDEEVTYDELIQGSSKNKAGYVKIRFCAQQAKRDRLEYFWVDTCCINKADPVELREAISSMFRWYQNAARCYVFLSDVPYGERKADTGLAECPWAAAFRASRWFTRGWTLQELLAPASVEFFSKEWRRLGDKASLQAQICEATRIPDSALRGAPLLQFSIDKRMKWSEHRETQVPEDRAYCLIGLLGVQMTSFYGEGVHGAFARLMNEANILNRCLQDLRLSDPHDDKKRIEDTKGGLLKDSYRWVLDNARFQQWRNDLQSQLLWVKGDPGKGKTMLLCGIINELQESAAKTVLVSYFFCQATDSRINSATAVLRGLLYLLVSQQPSLASHIRKRYDLAGKTMFEDANAWIVLTEIFADVLRDPSLNAAYLIIDALDECVTDLLKLLEFVAKQSSASSRVKWIVSSRNWPDIEERLERAGHKVRLSLELNAELVSAAVSIFIEQKVSRLAQEKKYDDKTRAAVLDHLVSNAKGTFLWVALVCQSLEATSKRHVLRKLESFPPGLDYLYERMMQQISKSDDADVCKHILALIALVYRPITLKELAALVEQLEHTADNLGTMREIIGFCGSFLTVREETVYLVHQSAKDFLLAKAAEEVFPSGTEDAHYTIFARSLEVMSRTLRRDIYSLKAPGCRVDDAEQPNADPLAASRYSCIYWVDHLHNSKSRYLASRVADLRDGNVVHVFMREKFLYWLEALSLCKSMSKGVVSIVKLWSLVQETEETCSFTELVHDAYRFIMYHKRAIESSPLQAYMSALLFSPAGSLVRRLFQHEEPEWIAIKPGMGEGWSACLQTLEGHSDSVYAVAFSHDSTRLASASGDNTVKVWDASSGACLQTLEGHSHHVRAVAFSHDSTRLASASWDRTVKVWDASTGACLQTLEGHSGEVNAVVFSHDSTQLASASWDSTVKVWDASSGTCLQTLKGHSAVMAVAFSHDSTRLASASWDSTVKVWDASSGACLQTLEGHSHHIRAVAFSHDSTRLASASWDRTVKVWDASTGACLQTLEGHSSFLYSVAFSHDSTRLASASDDSTVKVWDASSGTCLQTLEGHSSFLYSVAFSHDSTRLASASDDSTVKVWDASSGTYLQTLKGHSGAVYAVAFSHDSTQLASASDDSTVKVWDASSGTCLQTLEGHSDGVYAVAFSHDSTRLASASDDSTVKVWDASSGTCLQTLEGHSDGVMAVAFSHDSTRLASASRDSTVKVWDASGACLQTLKGHSRWVSAVAFSHDSTRLASASDDSTVKVWDASSGACLQTLETAYLLYSLSFDPNGAYLHTDYGSIAIRALTNPWVGNNTDQRLPQSLSMGISSDRTWIAYNNRNMLWVPSEYRPACSTVAGTSVGIGVGSGRVWICRLDSDRAKEASSNC